MMAMMDQLSAIIVEHMAVANPYAVEILKMVHFFEISDSAAKMSGVLWALEGLLEGLVSDESIDLGDWNVKPLIEYIHYVRAEFLSIHDNN